MAAFIEAWSPTSVITDRLCEPSDEWSSTRTPGVAPTAATIRSTTSGRRPSLMLGIDSMIGMVRLYHAAGATDVLRRPSLAPSNTL